MCPVCMYYRIYSVLGELSCTKLKERCIKNSICQCRPGEGNLMATCPVYFLTLQYHRKFLFFSSESQGNAYMVHDMREISEEITVVSMKFY